MHISSRHATLNIFIYLFGLRIFFLTFSRVLNVEFIWTASMMRTTSSKSDSPKNTIIERSFRWILGNCVWRLICQKCSVQTAIEIKRMEFILCVSRKIFSHSYISFRVGIFSLSQWKCKNHHVNCCADTCRWRHSRTRSHCCRFLCWGSFYRNHLFIYIEINKLKNPIMPYL